MILRFQSPSHPSLTLASVIRSVAFMIVCPVLFSLWKTANAFCKPYENMASFLHEGNFCGILFGQGESLSIYLTMTLPMNCLASIPLFALIVLGLREEFANDKFRVLSILRRTECADRVHRSSLTVDRY